MTKKYLPGIQIRMDQADSLRVQEWIYEIDWQILSKQFEKRKSVLAFDTQPPDGGVFPRFHRLDKLPTERGRFRPHYGDTGGGFEYHIRSLPQGTQIIGHSRAAEFYKITPPPLEILLENKVDVEVFQEPNKWGGSLYPPDNRFTEGENIFGFYGDFFKIFHAWEWYSEDTEPFEFEFVPMSMGCLIRVLHIESNTLLDLTKDVDW